MRSHHFLYTSIFSVLFLIGCALKNPGADEFVEETQEAGTIKTDSSASVNAGLDGVEDAAIEVQPFELAEVEPHGLTVRKNAHPPPPALSFSPKGRKGRAASASRAAIGRGGAGHGAAYLSRRPLQRRPELERYRYIRPQQVMVASSREEYTDHGVNPFTLVESDSMSTFAIDVDTASYTMSRRRLQQGILPAWEGVRVEEFVNYFDYDYSSPKSGPFSVDMEAMPNPFRPGYHILRVGIQAKQYEPRERPPLHLTFLVDVSGSMSSPDKLRLAKASMHTLVRSLKDGDTVAMATYAGRVARILEPTNVVQSSSIHRAIDALESGGSTAMSSGIDLAYQMADESFERGAENRVVILSDGDANVGRTSWDELLGQIKGYADQGITLSTIGFGQGNYRDTLMEQLANKGDGNNFYVDSQDESDRIFGEKIGGTLITVARDTKIQVGFNPDAVHAYRLLGYENRDVADKDFRNDRVDAGEVGSGHSVTALYEVRLAESVDKDLATVRIRWERPGADGEATERAFQFDSNQFKPTTRGASESLRLAFGAATFAEVLRQSPHAAEVDLVDLQEIIDGVANSKQTRELSRLIGMAERLGATDQQVAWLKDR